jgi:hypothetical protein
MPCSTDTPYPLTGDFPFPGLFPGGPGKTWSAADFTSLMNDLEWGDQRLTCLLDAESSTAPDPLEPSRRIWHGHHFDPFDLI